MTVAMAVHHNFNMSIVSVRKVNDWIGVLILRALLVFFGLYYSYFYSTITFDINEEYHLCLSKKGVMGVLFILTALTLPKVPKKTIKGEEGNSVRPG